MATREASQSPERAGDLVRALFGGAQAARLSGAQLAARAWYAANGDRERSHTTGVWLRKSGREGVDPVMVVRLDSNLLAQELGTNKDLYLARLSHAGVKISDIRFTAGGKKTHEAHAGGRASHKKPDPLPPLDEARQARVDAATSHLPERLQKSVARAMAASMRRQSK